MNKVDIIVVTHNARNKLKACLDSIRRHTKDASYMLTVIDNHSTDGTWGFLKSIDYGINIIRTESNKGFSYAANAALRKTSNEYVALLDDDVEVTRGWLEGLLKQMKYGKNIGIIGPKIVLPDNQIFCTDASLKRMRAYCIGEMDRGQRDYIKECDAIPGPCWLMRRKVITDVGYFDESFFPCYQEDFDYCLRTRLAGYKIIFCAKITVIHHNLKRSWGNEIRNTALLKRKWRKVMRSLPLKDSSPEIKWIEKGFDYCDQGKWLNAFRSFKRAEKECPGFVGPYYMAQALYEAKRYKEAKAEFERALDIYSPDCEVYKVSMHRLYVIYRKIGLGQQVLDIAIRLKEMKHAKPV